MSEQKCIHCNHVWNYKGIYTIMTTCPNCQKKTPVIRTQEELDILKQMKEIKENQV